MIDDGHGLFCASCRDARTRVCSQTLGQQRRVGFRQIDAARRIAIDAAMSLSRAAVGWARRGGALAHSEACEQHGEHDTIRK